MQRWIKREGSIALKNIRAGSRVALFRPAAIAQVTATTNQVFVLVLFDLVLSSLVELVQSLPGPRFNMWGLASMAAGFCVFLLLAYALSLSNKKKTLLLKFMAVVYSAAPMLTAVGVLVEFAYSRSDPALTYLIWACYTGWLLAVLMFIVVKLSGRGVARAAPVAGLLVAGMVLMTALHVPMWYQEPDRGEETKVQLNAEAVFNSQFELLEAAKKGLRPARRGTPELYFLGFAAYGEQDVFKREVVFIKKLFDTRFGTTGRSIALINNRETVDTAPLATGSNLRRVLKMLARKMNTRDDVLFLYLTSHGSPNHKLAVELWPLGLNPVTPAELKSALDDAGIRWRVLLVSACYSGGFMAPFQDDHTLVMTAAAVDKQSFGCASEREFTYFGEAVFKEQLSREKKFIPALTQALESIRQRERNEKLEPSNPQIHIGSFMPDKLRQIERRLFAAD